MQNASTSHRLFKNGTLEQFAPIFAAYFVLVRCYRIYVFQAFFGRKTLEKSPLAHLSSAKKGAKMHFKRLKILFSKNSAKIDDFCTLCELLTPNTKKFRGGHYCH